MFRATEEKVLSALSGVDTHFLSDGTFAPEARLFEAHDEQMSLGCAMYYLSTTDWYHNIPKDRLLQASEKIGVNQSTFNDVVERCRFDVARFKNTIRHAMESREQ